MLVEDPREPEKTVTVAQAERNMKKGWFQEKVGRIYQLYTLFL